MNKTKGFNFDTEKDKDVLDHIEKQGNQSEYIKRLVRDDMKRNSLESIIRREVDRHLKEIANGIKNSPGLTGHR